MKRQTLEKKCIFSIIWKNYVICLGMCNQQVARLRGNMLVSCISQVGCYAQDSNCGHPPTNHVNNNGDVPDLLFVNMGSPPAEN